MIESVPRSSPLALPWQPRRLGSGTSRLLLAVAAGAVLVVAAACTLAIPSGKLPRVEQRWVVTPLRASIGMDELINQGQALSNATAVRRSLAPGAAVPGGSGCSHSEGEVSIRSRNDEVVVNLGRTTLSCSLRALCPGCTSGRQPKPAFTHRTSEDVPLPNRSDLEVKSVRVIGGTVDLSLQHDLDFVPLGKGDLAVEVWSIGDQDTAPEELLAFSLDRDFVGGTPIRYTHHFSSHPVTVVGGVRLVLEGRLEGRSGHHGGRRPEPEGSGDGRGFGPHREPRRRGDRQAAGLGAGPRHGGRRYGLGARGPGHGRHHDHRHAQQPVSHSWSLAPSAWARR